MAIVMKQLARGHAGPSSDSCLAWKALNAPRGTKTLYCILIVSCAAQGGLAKLLNLLRSATLCLRAAGAADIKVEKQVAYHAAHALRVYLRVHLVAHAAALRLHRLSTPAAQVSADSLLYIHLGFMMVRQQHEESQSTTQAITRLDAPICCLRIALMLLSVQPWFAHVQGFASSHLYEGLTTIHCYPARASYAVYYGGSRGMRYQRFWLTAATRHAGGCFRSERRAGGGRRGGAHRRGGPARRRRLPADAVAAAGRVPEDGRTGADAGARAGLAWRTVRLMPSAAGLRYPRWHAIP